MSRTEETRKKRDAILEIFKKLNENDIADADIVASATEAAKVEMLEEIAESLASIADSLVEINARQALKDI